LQLRDKYGSNMGRAMEAKMLHSYPKLMFLLLPFFALLLKWFFPRKSMVYVDHAIFSIHMHTFIFMMGLIGIALELLLHTESIYIWIMLPIFLYFIFAVRNAYQVHFSTALSKSVFILAAYALGTAIVGFAFILLIFIIT
jgi:hypothetical protein